MRRKPVFGNRPFGKRDARLLLIAYFDPNGVDTIPQSVVAWQSLSRHEVVLLNLWPGREGRMRLPAGLDPTEFDGLVIHPTVSYSPAVVRSLDEGLKITIAAFDGVKILMKQDEQVNAGMLAPLVRDMGFDVVCTCVPLAEQEKVYPRAVIGEDCTLLQTYTGYLSLEMRQALPNGPRDLGLTYRGSIQPLAFGRLGYEKRGIGYDVAAALKAFPEARFDISSRWEDRLAGAAWGTFLERSSAVLGLESGANIFDFDGAVAEWCRTYDERHRGEDVTSYSYYKRAHDEFLHTVEGNVNYAQISPRHFEAAAAGAAQVLYEGEYSGIFKQHRHFFPLKRDLSNIDAVVDFLRDETAQRRMTECAFEEIILDRNNWYESFVATVDSVIDAKLATKGRRPEPHPTASAARPLAYVLCAHDPTIDPRIGWFAETLGKSHDVVVIGTFPFNSVGDGPSLSEGPNGVRILRVERTRHEAGWLPTASELQAGAPSEARALLAALVGYAAAPDRLLKRRLGADVAVASELSRFRALCTYMVNTNAALIGALEELGAPNLLIAADLEALFAAVACKETTGARIVFDAHEYWPWSYTDFQHWEIEFWSAMEGRLAALADLNVTVTPQLAERMGHEYGVPFRAAPNAATRREGDVAGLEETFARRVGRQPFCVLYQGGFAQGRGLEEVISAWPHLRSDARLVLRGPDNPYRRTMIDFAQSLGLDEGQVSFPPAVPESDLISAALEADIGLIPYNPVWFGYRYCCPNKLSQYAAAGLPILSSTTEFVADLVKKNGIGHVIDIADPKRLAAFVDQLAGKREELVEMGRRSRAFFEQTFNWEALTAPIMAEIEALEAGEPPRRADFGWLIQRRAHPPRGAAAVCSPTLFGGDAEERSGDVVLFERGAAIVGSSSFCGFPHDAAYLLRQPKLNGYAAAQEGAEVPHWIEIDLGATRAIGALEIDWYDTHNHPMCYRVLARTITDAVWRELVQVVDATTHAALHRFAPVSFRYLRLEASAFFGQQRMLIRSFRALQAADAQGAAPAVGVKVAPVAPAAKSLEAAHGYADDRRIEQLLALSEELEAKRAAGEERIKQLLALSEELEAKRAAAEQSVAALSAPKRPYLYRLLRKASTKLSAGN
jgi:glycosyltransferase involved in cell wall biosynthesis